MAPIHIAQLVHLLFHPLSRVMEHVDMSERRKLEDEPDEGM